MKQKKTREKAPNLQIFIRFIDKMTSELHLLTMSLFPTQANIDPWGTEYMGSSLLTELFCIFCVGYSSCFELLLKGQDLPPGTEVGVHSPNKN